MRNEVNEQFPLLMSILLGKGERLSSLTDWLRNSVWSQKRFDEMEPQRYFESGEKLVRYAEELVLTTAPTLYDEFVAASESTSALMTELSIPKTALVVFDGISIREIPLLERLAKSTGMTVHESRYSFAALPSETISFVEQRLLAKRVSPSQLEGRRELKDLNIGARYYDGVMRVFELKDPGESLLLWSSFPDGTYMNFEARSSGHFETIAKQFDVAWKNIILNIPRDYRIIITGDHGYIYLGTGFESEIKAEKALSILDNDRFRVFQDGEVIPSEVPELQVLGHRNTAMLRGRIKNRPKGQSANRVFRHGGMSIMEMLTPWLVLNRP